MKRRRRKLGYIESCFALRKQLLKIIEKIFCTSDEDDIDNLDDQDDDDNVDWDDDDDVNWYDMMMLIEMIW